VFQAKKYVHTYVQSFLYKAYGKNVGGITRGYPFGCNNFPVCEYFQPFTAE
jgi:hypothetical protein